MAVALPAIEQLVEPSECLPVDGGARVVCEGAHDRLPVHRGHRAFEALQVLDQVALPLPIVDLKGDAKGS